MKLTKENIRSQIIKNAVINMHEFGYEYANEENIINDEVYSIFFKSMLQNNLGKASKRIDEVIVELIGEIDNLPK